ncbi:hypothetical protein [Bacillus sp. RO1]|uniref:hypothetical protein n=1 Tax=Bacillus sp. RO1 TaxID=2722703 RepID=UPI001456708E|nr:hypothetical protein [Bacillus sp. RO1]NLP52430.1 hypothetical protein [Bacillus sp. RO1]
MNQDWIQEQIDTTHHRVAIFLFPLVIFFGYLHPFIFGIGMVIFFLVTSFKLLKSMLFWMIILGAISIVLPFLAPVIFLVMIVLFILRIKYVIVNWRPFVSGIFLYGIVGVMIGRSTYLSTYAFLSMGTVIEGAIMSAIAFVGLRTILRWLYSFNYTSYGALGIMGSVPVIIIAFVLPFLKLHIGGDFFMEKAAVETKPVTGEPLGSRTIPSSGEPLIHVKEHIRTAPDGDPTNNLSYNGPDKKMPSGEIVTVKEHVRTAPDGDLTNNLSYNGNSTAGIVMEEQPEELKWKRTIVENAQASVPGQTAVDQLLRELKRQQQSS